MDIDFLNIYFSHDVKKTPRAEKDQMLYDALIEGFNPPGFDHITKYVPNIYNFKS